MENTHDFSMLETTDQASDDPFALFGAWFGAARQSEPADPDAMSLATIDAAGRPSVRIVLMKSYDARGFVFYTNRNSYKGQALAANHHAALCFHWKSLARQVRIQGIVNHVSELESDAYFASRPRGSKIGAWASRQSETLENRSVLAERVKKFEQEFDNRPDIPRPPHWAGYRIVPDKIEFWDDGTYRLHTRLLYTKDGDLWRKTMLYP